MTKHLFQVQELAAGKWWPIRSYDNEQEAQDHAQHLGYKARVKAVKSYR